MKADLEKVIFDMLVDKYKAMNNLKELDIETQKTLLFVASEKVKDLEDEIQDEILELSLKTIKS
jgi:hypothetical protein